MNEPKRGYEEGLRVAEYFGAEYQANLPSPPGDSRIDYYESIAWYFGHETWKDVPANWRVEAAARFDKGIADEKAANRR